MRSSKISRSTTMRGSQTVEKALRVVDTVASYQEPMRLTELAHAADMNISTMSRLLDSLERHGYVRRDMLTDRYRLGYKFLHFANVVRLQSNFDEIASEALDRLARETDETATLSILVGQQAMVAVRVVPPSVQNTRLAVGMLQQLHCTAAGKAILAYQSDDEIERVLSSELMKYTNETIIEADALRKELERVRDCGFALSFGEWDRDLAGIAAPVIHQTGTAIASCGVVGSLHRIQRRDLRELAPTVMSAAMEITRNIGGIPKKEEANLGPLQSQVVDKS